MKDKEKQIVEMEREYKEWAVNLLKVRFDLKPEAFDIHHKNNYSFENCADCLWNKIKGFIEEYLWLQKYYNKLHEQIKNVIWLTPEEYQRYNRFLVEWNIGKIKRVNQDNSKNGIIHLARRKNEANGYDIENDKLIYFSNLLDGYKHEFKNLQEICDEMNGLHKRFDSYEEQLVFWKGKAKEKIPEDSVVLTKEEAERFRGQTINIAKIKSQASKETAEKILAIIGNMIDECDDRFKLKDYQWHKDLCRQYGVEIKE